MDYEKIYKTVKEVHDAEQKRHGELLARAKMFIGLPAAFIGLLGLKVDWRDIPTMPLAAQIVYMAAMLGFIAAILFSLIALGIKDHRGLFSVTGVIENLKAQPDAGMDKFFAQRIGDVERATTVNSAINNNRASRLKVSSWLLFIGIVLTVIVFVCRFFY